MRERIQNVQDRIKAALQRSPHGPRPVTVMGASKAQSLMSIREAAEQGVLDMGENYAQELLTKAPLCLDTKIRWHFIGRLQSNKIRHLLPYISSIDSLDSLELAEKISRTRATFERPLGDISCLLQVNLGSERQKSGLPPAIIENLFDRFLEIEGLVIRGLMTIPPQVKDPEKSRPHFASMKELFGRLKARHKNPGIFQVLSMGMSRDFEIAIEEGATVVRIGEALFGKRPTKES